MTIDARTLGAFRVAFSLLLFFDLCKRASGIEHWYVPGGFLPPELVQDTHPHAWSFFFWLDQSWQVAAGFLVCALVYLALLVGYRTRVAQALALVCVLSLQHRVQFLTSGGDLVIAALCWWTVFLPLGRRFSVDAFAGRARAGANGPKLGNETVNLPDDRVVSLAVLGLMLQISIIYLLNALHKSGQTWHEGSAIHYALWLDRLATPFAVWYRGILAPEGSWLLSWGTRLIEGLIPLLVLSPVGKPWTRRLAITAIAALHVGIAMMLNVGPFSPAMIVFSCLLLTSADWCSMRRIGQRLRPRSLRMTASPATGIGDFALRGRHASQTKSLASWPVRRVCLAVRELAVVLVMVVVATATLVNNFGIPRVLRPEPPPAWYGPMAQAMQLAQGWWMFAPEVSKFEMTVVVDARTADGRHIDPYNAAGARVAEPWIRDVSERMGYDIFWNKYTLLLSEAPKLHGAFRNWVLSHHERTGRPTDRIVHFAAVVVVRRNPPPGGDYPWPDSQRILME